LTLVDVGALECSSARVGVRNSVHDDRAPELEEKRGKAVDALATASAATDRSWLVGGLQG
jgi:hypothetical protein